MKVLLLVNGSPESADGMRALALSKQLPKGWKVSIAYRGPSKFKSIFLFLRRALIIKPRVVVVIKMAYSGVIAGMLAKVFFRCAVVCDTGDAAYALAKSSGRHSKLQLGVIWFIERLGTYGANHVITRGSYHKRLLAEWNVNCVTVIPDGVDTEVESPRDGVEIRHTLGLEGQFVVGIIGSMSWSIAHQFCYGWDIVEALQFLRDLSVALILVGDGTGRSRLERRANELNVTSKVHFLGMQPYARLGEFLGVMDVCISTQSADLVGMVRTTGKLPLYLSHDKFVIATDVGEARRVLSGVGILLPYDGVRDAKYPERLAQAIRQLVKDPTRVKLCGSARKIAVAEFDYSNLGKRFHALLSAFEETRID